MWRAALTCCCVAVAGCAAEPLLDGPRVWRFEEDTVDRPAAGWVVPRVTDGGGTAPAGRWIIEHEPRAPSPAHVLRQTTSHFEGEHSNVVVADTRPVRDFRLAVRLRAYPGARAQRITEEFAARGLAVPADADLRAVDSGGGPLFRYADARNYYVVRWNPLASVVELAVVHAGRWSTLARAAVHTTSGDGTWHQLEVACRGPRIVCAFDGLQVLDHADHTHDAGRIGLWTRAGSSAGFDDVQLTPLGPPAAP